MSIYIVLYQIYFTLFPSLFIMNRYVDVDIQSMLHHWFYYCFPNPFFFLRFVYNLSPIVYSSYHPSCNVCGQYFSVKLFHINPTFSSFFSYKYTLSVTYFFNILFWSSLKTLFYDKLKRFVFNYCRVNFTRKIVVLDFINYNKLT